MVAALTDWYTATRTGDVLALDRLLNLFAEDAVYIEPFSGPDTTHAGKANIRGYLDALRQQATPRGTQVTLREAVVDRDTITVAWSWRFPSIPQPTLGYDIWMIENGLVRRLETRFLE